MLFNKRIIYVIKLLSVQTMSGKVLIIACRYVTIAMIAIPTDGDWGNDAMPATGVQHRSNLIVLSRQEQFHENFV